MMHFYKPWTQNQMLLYVTSDRYKFIINLSKKKQLQVIQLQKYKNI